MSRKNRIWYPDVVMHITARGNHKNDIFRNEEDYKAYIFTLQDTIDYFNRDFEVLCYALMTNHIHLQIETKETHIGFFMKRLNNLYAKYFNNKYDYVGHLFQERYASQIIDSDQYMVETSRYIHLNPVRANIVEKPDDYKWSSFNTYIGKKEENIINCERVLSYFKHFKGKNEKQAYRAFVESGIER